MLILFILLTFAAFSGSSINDICGGCFHTCHNGKCDEYGCKPGNYGALCDQPCPTNCANGATKKPLCNHTTGACLSGCINGYHGQTCSLNCSRNCLSSLCTQSEGYCVQGCKKHHFGLRCSKDCYNTCAGKQCDRNGLCGSCVNGYWGLFCENQCNSNCVQNVCNMTKHGRPQCSLGCVEGWSGPNCDVVQVGDKEETRLSRVGRATDVDDEKCYQPVVNGTCSCCRSGFEKKDKKCEFCQNCLSKFHGECISYCKNGFYGLENSCTSQCSERCFHEDNTPRCNYTDGKCISCPNGKYGDFCEYPCSAQCINNTCFQNSGQCLECPKSKYGYLCDRYCNKTCENSLCDRFNGTCTEGCQDDMYGPYCNNNCTKECANFSCSYTIFGKIVCTYGCVEGYWGKDCRNRCDMNCTMCDRKTGECISSWRMATSESRMNSEASDTSSLKVGLIITLVVLAIVIILCIVFAALAWNYRQKVRILQSATGNSTLTPLRNRGDDDQGEQ